MVSGSLIVPLKRYTSMSLIEKLLGENWDFELWYPLVNQIYEF